MKNHRKHLKESRKKDFTKLLNESLSENNGVIDFLKKIKFGDEFDFKEVGDWDISAWTSRPLLNFSNGFYIVQLDNDKLSKHFVIPDNETEDEFIRNRDSLIKRHFNDLNESVGAKLLNSHQDGYKEIRVESLSEGYGRGNHYSVILKDVSGGLIVYAKGQIDAELTDEEAKEYGEPKGWKNYYSSRSEAVEDYNFIDGICKKYDISIWEHDSHTWRENDCIEIVGDSKNQVDNALNDLKGLFLFDIAESLNESSYGGNNIYKITYYLQGYSKTHSEEVTASSERDAVMKFKDLMLKDQDLVYKIDSVEKLNHYSASMFKTESEEEKGTEKHFKCFESDLKNYIDSFKEDVKKGKYNEVDVYIIPDESKAWDSKLVWTSDINESLNEASYGGAFDIEDDQFFTRDDINEFGYDIADQFSAWADSTFDLSDVYMDTPTKLHLEVFNHVDYEGYEANIKIDMRRIRSPKDLYRYEDKVLRQLKDAYLEYHAEDEMEI